MQKLKYGAILCRAKVGYSTIQILICDEDAVFLENFQRQIRAILEQENAAAVIHTFDCRENIPQQVLDSCDIAFLGINYSGRQYTGIDIARDLRKLRQECVIIFVSNDTEYAPEGYEVQAFRFLLKKQAETKLEQCLRQAFEKTKAGQGIFRIELSGKSFTIPLADVLFIEARAHEVVIHVKKRGDDTSAKYRSYDSLKSVTERLTERGFLRIQRSYLVNMQRINKFQCQKAELDDGTVLRMTEKNYNENRLRYLLWTGTQ